jgi:hypothetical protein
LILSQRCQLLENLLILGVQRGQIRLDVLVAIAILVSIRGFNEWKLITVLYIGFR